MCKVQEYMLFKNLPFTYERARTLVNTVLELQGCKYSKTWVTRNSVIRMTGYPESSKS